MDNTKKVKLTAIVVLALCGLLILGFILYNVLVFRVTRAEPDPVKFPTITPYIDIYFSKPVDKVSAYTLNEEVSGSISIEKNKVRYTPGSMYEANKNYVLHLSGVRSKSGDTLDYSYVFTAKYMNFSDVPEEIQKASIEKSSSGQIDDPFFNNYFPMQTNDFTIEHPYNDTDMDERKILSVTFLREVHNYDTGTKEVLSNDEAEKLRTKVIEYIKAKGGKPENYDIFYSNNYLNATYPQSGAYH